MEAASRHLATLPGLILGCLVCCALWGSAFPCIKIGYALFGIPAHDSASQLLFAGLRFTLAGALVIVGMSAAQRRPLIPQARDIKPIFVLSLFQTIGQYFFFLSGPLARQRHVELHHRGQRQLPRNPLCRPGISHREAQYGQGAWLCAGLCRRRARQPFGRGRHLWLYARRRGLYLGFHCCRRSFDLPDRHLLAQARRCFACRLAVFSRRPGPHRHRLFDGRHIVPDLKRPRHRAHHLHGAYLRRRVLAVVPPARRQPRQPACRSLAL